MRYLIKKKELLDKPIFHIFRYMHMSMNLLCLCVCIICVYIYIYKQPLFLIFFFYHYHNQLNKTLLLSSNEVHFDLFLCGPCLYGTCR